MNRIYNKIYEAINAGIQKALIINNDQSQDTSVTFHNKEITSEFIPYELRTVDLDLPSGLLWCEYNLGAYPGNKAKNWYGDYYAWGETEPNGKYTYDIYKHWSNKSDKLKKYNTNIEYGENIDNLTYIMPEDDACKMLGENFKMPTKADYQELIDMTTQEWVENYKGIPNLNGILFISKSNSKTLFFPAVGCYSDNKLYNEGKLGGTWTANLDLNSPIYAYILVVRQPGAILQTYVRRFGTPIRAVNTVKII